MADRTTKTKGLPAKEKKPGLPPKRTLQDMLYYIKLERYLEDKIERKLYRQGKIVGGVYVGRGQEAIAVASSIQLEKDDVICPSHRDMGAFLIRGMAPRNILAQYMGRTTGPTRGRDGNMHMGDLKYNLIAFVSMLGNNVAAAGGIALSFKIRKQNRVVLAFFGDGSISTGVWHEAMNFISVQQLPVVLICNNNAYAYSTPNSKQFACKDVADRGEAYGIPAEIVDGNDVLAVYGAARRGIERARSGGGPTLIECKTFRMTGHSAHDDAGYVPKKEFEEWAKKDPILRYEKFLREDGIVTDAEILKMQTRIEKEVDEAAVLAEKDPYPAPEDCLKDVYADPSLDPQVPWWRVEGKALDTGKRDWGEYSTPEPIRK